MRYLIIALVLLGGSSALAHAQHGPAGGILEAKTPDGRFVVVEAGLREPASTGTYVVRLYGAANAQAPADDFVAASKVMPRDGTLLRLEFANVGGDDSEELIVVVENAGSGSYLSADAFDVQKTDVLDTASVSNLPPNTNLIEALRK